MEHWCENFQKIWIVHGLGLSGAPDSPLTQLALFEHAPHWRSRIGCAQASVGPVVGSPCHCPPRRDSLAYDINNFPDGGRFFCLDTANGILSLPLRVLFHPVLTFNLLVLAHLFAAGLSAGTSVFAFVKDQRAAVVGGRFSCAPFVMAHGLASGVSEGIFLFPMPLILLCMLRMATRDSWKYPIWAAVLLVIQGLGSWHYGVLAGFDRGLWCHCGALQAAVSQMAFG